MQIKLLEPTMRTIESESARLGIPPATLVTQFVEQRWGVFVERSIEERVLDGESLVMLPGPDGARIRQITTDGKPKPKLQPIRPNPVKKASKEPTEKCRHPMYRKIGTGCGECGNEGVQP